ncbi:hypothetical protein D3C71_1588960 [compost metagenome]
MTEKYKAYLMMTDLEGGLMKSQLQELVNTLPDGDTEYIPVSIPGEANSSAHGFVDAEFQDTDELNPELVKTAQFVLNDFDNEREDRTYESEEGNLIVYIDIIDGRENEEKTKVLTCENSQLN